MADLLDMSGGYNDLYFEEPSSKSMYCGAICLILFLVILYIMFTSCEGYTPIGGVTPNYSPQIHWVARHDIVGRTGDGSHHYDIDNAGFGMQEHYSGVNDHAVTNRNHVTTSMLAPKLQGY